MILAADGASDGASRRSAATCGSCVDCHDGKDVGLTVGSALGASDGHQDGPRLGDADSEDDGADDGV